MSRTVKIVLAIVVVVALVGGLGLWYYIADDDAPEKLSLTDSPSSGSGTTSAKPATIDGTWKVAPASSGSQDTAAGYRVIEKFVGGVARKTAVGRTKDVTGTVRVSDEVIRSANVRVDLTTLESDRSQRDAALRARGLETNTYPSATFTLVKPVALPKIQSGKKFTVKATGRLNLHNVTRTITVDLEARGSGSTFQVARQIPDPDEGLQDRSAQRPGLRDGGGPRRSGAQAHSRRRPESSGGPRRPSRPAGTWPAMPLPSGPCRSTAVDPRTATAPRRSAASSRWRRARRGWRRARG